MPVGFEIIIKHIEIFISKLVSFQTSFIFKPVSTDNICEKLKSINPKKASGFDNVPGKLLKIAHKELCVPLTSLINSCMRSNTFPVSMKYAELSPIYKKSDSMFKGNFRPVSILTSLSKLYESVMNDQLVEYFSPILNRLLSAYRKGYSCQSILLKCIEDWKDKLAKNNFMGVLFMDLSKAFDCLPHRH